MNAINSYRVIHRAVLVGLVAGSIVGLTACNNAAKTTATNSSTTATNASSGNTSMNHAFADSAQGSTAGGTSLQSDGTAGKAARAHNSTQEIQLIQATTVGIPHFPDGDTAAGGNGQTVDGIPGNNPEMTNYHIHVHLSLFVNGKQIAIPKGIGIVPPRVVDNGFVDGGKALYFLHTHDATGIIHVESPQPKQFTLKQFFDIWGQPLQRDNIAGFHGTVHAFVDGKPYSGNLADIVFTPHEEITLEVGSPVVVPPVYIFPAGL